MINIMIAMIRVLNFRVFPFESMLASSEWMPYFTPSIIRNLPKDCRDFVSRQTHLISQRILGEGRVKKNRSSSFYTSVAFSA